MSAPPPERQPRFIQRYRGSSQATRAQLVQGLLEPQARIAPKHFYDALGSRLFDAITELPEYYPTRTEAALLAGVMGEIVELLGGGHTLVDLGAGNCEKAARLFGPLAIARYVAVDISVDYLRDVLDRLQRRHPKLEMTGLGVDFSQALELPEDVVSGPCLLFYPGSSIGNFSPPDALRFLRQARAAARGGALLIGIDLVKSKPVLEAAYDDALGVTAAFNRNVLNAVNRALDADFDVAQWAHVAFFNGDESRIEMHLQVGCDTVVHWQGGERSFAAGERIHTENSYKYRSDDFADLLRQAGFDRVTAWRDANEWFGVFVAQA